MSGSLAAVGEQRAEEDAKRERGPLGTALSTSVHGNATAFGFSITITVSFGVLNRLEGSPTLLELLLYGVAAALAVALLEALVTYGFRRRAGEAPSEVQMLGSAMNALSVAAGIGAAIGLAKLIDGTAAWPAAAFVASTVFILVESAEVRLAEAIQRLRGDPDAEEEE